MRTGYLPQYLRASSQPCCFSKMKHFLANNSLFIKMLFSIMIVITLYLGGVLTYFFEDNYLTFQYSPEINDFRTLIESIDQKLNDETGSIGYETIQKVTQDLKKVGLVNSSIHPLEDFRNLDFTIDIKNSCQNHSSNGSEDSISQQINEIKTNDYVSFVIVVKTAINYYEKRDAIRKSWYLNGQLGSFRFRTVFMVGACDPRNPVPLSLLKLKGLSDWTVTICNESIRNESEKYGDIIQSSGVDSYYNNTIKSFMMLRWFNERCKTDFVVSIDDDYVLEMENLVDYLRTLAKDYLPENDNVIGPDKESDIKPNSLEYSKTQATKTNKTSNHYQLSRDYVIAFKRLSNQHLWSGYQRIMSRPFRIVTNKWYISRADYPFDRYPPYITGGMIVMSKKTAKHMFLANYFTKTFKFDDVYMGIVAKRLGLIAYHSDNYMCNIRQYIDKTPFRPNATQCLGVHDIEATKLIKLWDLRKRFSIAGLSYIETTNQI